MLKFKGILLSFFLGVFTLINCFLLFAEYRYWLLRILCDGAVFNYLKIRLRLNFVGVHLEIFVRNSMQ